MKVDEEGWRRYLKKEEKRGAEPERERGGVRDQSPCRVVVDGSEYLPLGAHALLDASTARQKAGQFCAEKNVRRRPRNSSAVNKVRRGA